MIVAFLLTAVLWTHPAPQVWVCNPGKAPSSAPSNCERMHFAILGKFPL